jgi:hypothetical protein
MAMQIAMTLKTKSNTDKAINQNRSLRDSRFGLRPNASPTASNEACTTEKMPNGFMLPNVES